MFASSSDIYLWIRCLDAEEPLLTAGEEKWEAAASSHTDDEEDFGQQRETYRENER